MATIDLLYFWVVVAVAVADCDSDAMLEIVLLLLPVCTIDWAVDSFSLISDGGLVVGLTGFEYLYEW